MLVSWAKERKGEMGDGRWEMGDGRWKMEDGFLRSTAQHP
jgi:hypothetical protein